MAYRELVAAINNWRHSWGRSNKEMMRNYGALLRT